MEEGDVLLGGSTLVEADGYLSKEADLIHILDTNVYQLPEDGKIRSIWMWVSNDGLIEFQVCNALIK